MCLCVRMPPASPFSLLRLHIVVVVVVDNLCLLLLLFLLHDLEHRDCSNRSFGRDCLFVANIVILNRRMLLVLQKLVQAIIFALQTGIFVRQSRILTQQRLHLH